MEAPSVADLVSLVQIARREMLARHIPYTKAEANLVDACRLALTNEMPTAL